MIWHSNTAADVLRELDTDAEGGLTQEQAAQRTREFGENRLAEKKPAGPILRFFRQLNDPMVIILLLAAAVSMGVCLYSRFVKGEAADWLDPIAIVLIVLLNAVLGVIQESRAEAALQALKNLSAPQAHVRRDGAAALIPAAALVPGDIVELEAGDLVPADCRLLQSYSLRVNESALTGESLPAEKNAADVFPEIAPLADRTNMVYAGCGVTNGRAVAVVTATGMRSEMGHIASMLDGEQDGPTPLQQKMAQLGKYLGLLALAICVVIFIVGLIFRLKPLDMFMTAVSLAVAAIPEGLPTIVTIVLALGVQRMVKRNAIIRRLPAVETLGSTSVICSDKTGTLTQNRMTLRRLYVSGRILPLDGSMPEGSAKNLLQLAALCTDASLQIDGDGITELGDPTETAILRYLHAAGTEKSDLLLDMPLLGELPFDSERKRMTTVHEADGRALVIVKGAPEMVLSCCTAGHPDAAAKANTELGGDALRVLAVAFRFLDQAPASYTPEELEHDLTLAGLIGMIDPPREEVRDAIDQCDAAGIRTVMITGDNVVTASAIAKELGILHEGERAIDGAALAALPDEELARDITQYRVYARVTPADKIRIVKAWKAHGDVVAMTGDGINDAPALKAADIGCAMGVTGTDVAKNAADLTLTDDNFATIVSAVREGRGIYDNIRRSVHFLLSCNLGEILTVFVSLLLWRVTPLAPIQLLWLNLITDSLPALALGVEPPAKDIMHRRPRSRQESLLSGGVGIDCLWQGVMFAALTLTAYAIGAKAWGSAALGETMAFAVLAMGQLIHAFNVRSSRSLFSVGLRSNKAMLGAFGCSLLLLLAVLLIPGVQGVFSLSPMGGAAWGVVAGLSFAPFLLVEAVKLMRRLLRRGEKG